MKQYRLVCITVLVSVFLFPVQVFAQTEPGSDPFALTPEKLRMFGGYEGDQVGQDSLFSGKDVATDGLFTTPTTQLGGASPQPVIAPVADNKDSANFILITSAYTPTTGLTMDSKITLTVTLKNVSQVPVEDIEFTATLQDKNAKLLPSPAPEPPFRAGSSIADKLTWPRAGSSIDLDPGETYVMKWSFQPDSDNAILRWRFVATFGAGESILLQWIPITNPNPQAPSGIGTGTSPGSSAGIPASCKTNDSKPFPASSSSEDIIKEFDSRWGFILVDASLSWRAPQYKEVLHAWWDTLSAVECTPYLTSLLGGNRLTVEATNMGGYWWGEYMGDYRQIIDIEQHRQGLTYDPSRIPQNIIHELGHVWRGTHINDQYAQYEASLCGTGSPSQFITSYGATNCSENMSEIAGFYVARNNTEWGGYCDSKNPYDRGYASYYAWAKATLFGGKEFGPPPPSTPTGC